MEWFRKIVEGSFDENGNIRLETLLSDFNREFAGNAVIKAKYDEDMANLSKSSNEEKAALLSEIERLKANEKKILRDSAVDIALTKAGAKNIKAAKALLEIGDEADQGEIEDMVKALKEGEDTSFLFEKKTEFFGRYPEDGDDSGEISLDDMSYSEMLRFINGD